MQLLGLILGANYFGDVQLLHSMVRNLRCKLGDGSSDPRWIVDIPYPGYRLGRSQTRFSSPTPGPRTRRSSPGARVGSETQDRCLEPCMVQFVRSGGGLYGVWSLC